jgi:hypothetical protein
MDKRHPLSVQAKTNPMAKMPRVKVGHTRIYQLLSSVSNRLTPLVINSFIHGTGSHRRAMQVA